MMRAPALRQLVAGCVAMAALAACTATYPTRTVSYQPTTLEKPATPLSDAELLNVRIEVFDKGSLPEDPNVRRGLSDEIRSAESYYIPVQLKNTMQQAGQWGQVRVTPKGGRESEVLVTGRIHESDGEALKLEITAKDAAGVPWFTKKYESVIDTAAYSKAEAGGIDPFQDLYNQIANDLAAHRKKLKAEDTGSIRQIADLRFGAEFAPNTYRTFVKKTGDPTAKQQDDVQRFLSTFSSPAKTEARAPLYAVDHLPADDDPVVQRVNRIKAREEFLVDTLDQQYDTVARSMRDPYTQWRTARLKEINAIRAVDKAKNEEQQKAVAVGLLGVLAGAALASQGNRGCYGCTAAGVGVSALALSVSTQMMIRSSEQATAETELRKAALQEIGTSLASDVTPTVIEVEGKTVELKGSVEEKLAAWRKVLESLQELETGPQAQNAP